MFVYEAFHILEHRKPLFAINAIVLFLWVIWLINEYLVWQDFVIGVFLLYTLLYFRLVSYAGNSSFWNKMPYLLIGFSLGLMVRYLRLSRRLFYLYALMAITPFLYIFFIKNYSVNTGQFFATNRNTVPLLLIFAVSLQVLVDSTHKSQYIAMTPSLMTVMVAHQSKSRTGLLVSILLLVIIQVANVKTLYWYLKKYQTRYYKKIAIWFGVFLVSVLTVFLIFELLVGSRFSKEGLSTSGRIRIYLDFFTSLSPERLLSGFRPEWEFVNLHNTYFTLLSYYGIGSLIFYYLIGGTFLRLTRTSFIQAGLVAIICIYSISESIVPFTVGIFPMISLAMLAYPPKRLNKLIFPSVRKEAQESSAE